MSILPRRSRNSSSTAKRRALADQLGETVSDCTVLSELIDVAASNGDKRSRDRLTLELAARAEEVVRLAREYRSLKGLERRVRPATERR